MKTLKLGLIGIFLFSTMFSSTNSFAKCTIDTTDAILRAELTKMIQHPNLKENGITEAEIQLRFTIDAKNTIQVLAVDSENEYLNEFVRKNLGNKRLNIQNIKKDKVYYLTIKFELV